MLWPGGGVRAQKLYSLGGASILQTIDISTYKVVDRVTLIPSMSDIAFHPDGTLFGVNENSIYKIDTTDGSSEIIKQISSSYGWLVGLTIDSDGVFYMSGLGGDKDFVITYDPSDDMVVNLGSTGLRHWDLEFYNGQLYLSGGTDNTSEGFLIHIDPSEFTDLSQRTIVLDFGAQAYGMTSFNNACGSNRLIAVTSKDIILLDPESASFSRVALDDPLYTFSSGATSRSSYLGSLPPLKINSVEIGTTPCTIGATTTVDVTAYPGRADIEYSLDGITYQDSPGFTTVPIGIHQAFIRDASGCTDMSDPFEIKIANLAFTIESQVAHCGEDNGTLIPTASSMDDSLEFSINGVDFFTDSVFNDLEAGVYTIYARAQSGCVDSTVVSIEELPILSHQSETTPEHCDQSDGTIQVLASGGKEPYSYSVVALPPQTAPLITGLHASNYLVRILDDLGCVSEDLATVEMAPLPAVQDVIIQEAQCNMSDGSAEIIPFSNVSSPKFSINNGPYTSDALFQNLAPGIYTLNVVDEFGCDTLISFIIPDKDGPVIQNIDIEKDYCNSSEGRIEIEATASSGDLIYSINNGPFTSSTVFTGLTKGNYVIIVRDEFGCDAIENVSVDEEISVKIGSIDIVDATCGESNGSITINQSMAGDVEYSLDNIDFQQHPVFSGLSPGDYTAFLIDGFGCTDTAVASLKKTEQTEILEILTNIESCEGQDGDLTVLANSLNNNLQYSIDGSNFQTTEVFYGLNAGSYSAYLLDENGCLDSMHSIVYGRDKIVLNEINTTPASCGNSDGSISLDVEGEVLIKLNNERITFHEHIPDLAQGIYSITIKNLHECSLDTIVEISGTNCNVYIPNAFSPNGDGVNETLTPYFDPALFQLLDFQVFDRWGNNVFKCNGLCEWDGMQSGEASPAGVYVYYLQLQGQVGDISEIYGDVTLLR